MFQIPHRLPRTRRARVVFTCTATLLLAACGGGGGGGGGGDTATPAMSQLTVTSANQKAVAADALDTTNITAVAMGATEIAAGVQVTAPLPGTGTLRLLSATRALATGGDTTNVATGAQVTLQCTHGGTRLVDGTFAKAGVLSPGDVMTVTATDCKESLDGTVVTMNGRLSLRVVSGSYDAMNPVYPVHTVISEVATGFSIAAPSLTLTFDGDVLADETDTSATTGSMTLTGNALTTKVVTNAGTHASTAKNYRELVQYEGDTVTNDISATVETANPHLGSVYYQLTTPTPLAISGSSYLGGQLKVVGNHCALLVTVTNKDAFSLSLDAGGDGMYDATANTDINELGTYL